MFPDKKQHEAKTNLGNRKSGTAAVWAEVWESPFACSDSLGYWYHSLFIVFSNFIAPWTTDSKVCVSDLTVIHG